MNFYKSSILVAALAMGFGFTSCDDDDDLVFSGKPVANAEMREFLKGKGYQFNDEGNLLMDAKVAETDSLDLSGTKMTDLKDLVLFPNLKALNLSNNGYGSTFDFATVPAQITSINLSGNEIYDYANLIKVEIAENGEETITNLRNVSKLYLPEEAKENTTDLVRFYRQNKAAIAEGTLDMRMEDESGKLAKYTTLRSVSDANLSAFLQKSFATIFTDGKIDLSKRFTDGENLNPVIINQLVGEEYNVDVASLEGIQYIINNPYWEGTTITLQFKEAKELPAIKVPSFVTELYLEKLDAKVLDLSGAENLSKISLTDVNGLESFDLRGNKVWGQRDKEKEEQDMSSLALLGCKNLKSVYFPEAKQLRTYSLDLECLDALETCDLSKFTFIYYFKVGDLPDTFKLVYPNLTEIPSDTVIPELDMNIEGKITFGCSKKTYDIPATTEFIDKYKNFEGKVRIACTYKMTYPGNKGKYWR